MTLLRLVTLCLTTYRLTVLVTKDKGPGWLMLKLRRGVKKKAPKSTHMDEGIECSHCMSIWFGILVVFCEQVLRDNNFYECTLLAFALSGASIFLSQLERTK